jgi:hypothetical protein
MKDFIKDNSIDIKWELVDRLDNKVNTQIDKLNENKVRYNKWFIKRVEFSNFLSFGDSNVIDFTGLDGITVIESTPKNFGGKSTSSVDLLMFLFFNSTTKTKTNGEIFNRFTDKDEVSVRGEITIDGDDYVIERKTLRDLAASIKDGRYEEQSYRLNGLQHHNHNIIYLIEGDMYHFNAFKDRIDKQTLYSAMFSINFFKGFSVMRSNNIEETACRRYMTDRDQIKKLPHLPGCQQCSASPYTRAIACHSCNTH